MNTCPRCSGQVIRSYGEETCFQCGYEPTQLLSPIPVRLTEPQRLIRMAQNQRRWYRRHLPLTRIESRERAQVRRFRQSHERWYHSVRDYYRVKGEGE